MEEKDTKTTHETASTQLLANKEYEYVINFRHRFLTYYALPLFVLFLSVAGLISSYIRVPEVSTYPISMDIRNETIYIAFQGTLESAKEISLLAKETSLAAHIRYSRDEKAMIIEGTLFANGEFRTNTSAAKWPTAGPDEVSAELVVTTKGDRLFNKLVFEVIENMGIKKPALE